jgi:hypothetical protein
MTACKNSEQESTSAPSVKENDKSESPKPTLLPEPTEPPKTLQEIADNVADEFGKVEKVVETGSETIVFIFPENHASKLQRVEIAIMLNRLYARYNIRHLGLEGWLSDQPPMELTWAHQPPAYVPGTPISNREDVLSYMLKDGEFSSIEFVGLIYEDVLVHGIDDAELYARVIDDAVRYVPFDYLYAISLTTMSDADYSFWSELVTDEEIERAFEFAILSSDYTAEAMERYSEMQSSEEQKAFYQELINKAQEVGAELYPYETENIQALIDYTNVVIDRSDVFVESILNIAKNNPGGPVAMEIGFSHTARVIKLLEEAGVSYVSIYPISFFLEEDPSLLSLEAYQRKEEGLSPGGPDSIGRYITGRMPPPTADEITTFIQSYVNMFMQYVQNFHEVISFANNGELMAIDFSDWPEEKQEEFISGTYDTWKDMVNGTGSVHERIPWDQPWEYKFVDITEFDGVEGFGKVFIIEIKKPGDSDWLRLYVVQTATTKKFVPLEEFLKIMRGEMYSSFKNIPFDTTLIPRIGDFHQVCSTTAYAVSTGQ